MGGLLVVVKFSLHPLDVPTAEEHYRKLEPIMQEVPGYQGGVVGRLVTDPTKLLAVVRYADVESAERGLVTVSASPLETKLAVASDMSADVARYLVAEEGHATGTGAAVGQFMSITVRNAEPGRALELAEDLAMTFGELAVIPGFLGHTVGFHETLPEQACAIAAWTRPGAFEMSLPTGRLPDVQLYERIV